MSRLREDLIEEMSQWRHQQCDTDYDPCNCNKSSSGGELRLPRSSGWEYVPDTPDQWTGCKCGLDEMRQEILMILIRHKADR